MKSSPAPVRRRFIGFALALAVFAAAPELVFGQSVTTYPLYQEGVRVANSFDRTFGDGSRWEKRRVQVFNRYTGQWVWIWETYCNRLVIQAAADLGLTLPSTSANGLASHFDAGNGWIEVTSADAQRLANRGWLVVASWLNSTSPNEIGELHGHVALVRPSGTRDISTILVRGPQTTQAGWLTARVTDVAEGFGTSAWRNLPVRFFAYRLSFSR